jgi:hypothetical protein
MKCRFGSKSVFERRLRHVRFPPDIDHITDIARRRRRQRQTFDVSETEYFSLTVRCARWHECTVSRRASLSTIERPYLLVDEFIRSDRCAGTIPLAKLFDPQGARAVF